MMRKFKTFGNETESVVLEMDRSVGHEQSRDSKRGFSVNFCSRRILCRRARKREKPTVVRVVFAKHQDVFSPVALGAISVKSKLKKVVRRRGVDGWTKWTWDPLSSCCRETVNTGADKGPNVRRRSRLHKILLQCRYG